MSSRGLTVFCFLFSVFCSEKFRVSSFKFVGRASVPAKVGCAPRTIKSALFSGFRVSPRLMSDCFEFYIKRAIMRIS